MTSWDFTSTAEIKGDTRKNYMHVMAYGGKEEELQALVKKHLTISNEEAEHDNCGNLTADYIGTMDGIEYGVLLECGSCPTLEGAQGHNVIVTTSAENEDKLSTIIRQEMKGYEAEWKQHVKDIDKYLAKNPLD